MSVSKLIPSLVCLIGFASRSFAGDIQSAFDDAPKITLTTTGMHGDPINVGLVGTKDELIAAMLAAKWQPADHITFKSSVKLVTSVVLHRPDEKAPVSNLYLWKRKEDLAFEQQVGKDASRRHHVRFWESTKQVNGRPVWLGSATFDTKVGFSHKTGLPTHHIEAKIDADRDKLLNDLKEAKWLSSTEGIEGYQPKHDGRNGGGDPYHTDGKLSVGILEGR
jgi:hypothetical protein